MCKQFGIAVIRAVIIIANLLLLIGSIALIYRTASLYTSYKSYEEVLDSSIQVQPLISLILSILILGFSVFGFFAIWMNALGMTVFFIICMLLLGVGNIVFGILMLLEATNMYSDAKYFDSLLDQHINITADTDKMHAIDNIQRDLLCCGLSYEGWGVYVNHSIPLPFTCCKDPIHPCIFDDVWQDNCLFELVLYGVQSHTEVAALLITGGVQCLMTAAIGYVFAMAIRQYYYY